MNYFYWNKKFETGVKSIDEQHKQLVHLINQYSIAISSNQSLPALQETLKVLNEYVVFHFADEEKVLEQSTLSDDDKFRHAKQHKVFIAKLEKLISESDIEDLETSQNLHRFLTTWLVSHILGTDMQLARNLTDVDQKPADLPMDVSHVEYVLLSALNESEQRFRFYSDNSPMMVWISDINNFRPYFNQVFQEFVGSDNKLESTDWTIFIHPKDRKPYLDLINNLNPEKINTVAEYRLLRHDGHYRNIYERITPRFEVDSHFVGHIGSAMDITELKEAERLLEESRKSLELEVERRTEEINKLISIDELTGIGNRRFIMSRLAEECERSQRYYRPFSILFIDADYFKQINDLYGHNVGDIVLKALAEKIKVELRNTDGVGRYGGEEFIALLPEMEIEKAKALAERVRAAVEEMIIPQCPTKLTVSIGVAQYDYKETIEQLINRGDMALFKAKNTGRNKVITLAQAL